MTQTTSKQHYKSEEATHSQREEISVPSPQTPLAKRLLALRQRALSNGMVTLDGDGIEQEVRQRRGGWQEDKK